MRRIRAFYDNARVVYSTLLWIPMIILVSFSLVLLNNGRAVMSAHATRILDREITLTLQRKLFADDIVSAHLIDIKTTDGVVTLSGTVDHLLARDRSVKIAESMKGVQGVINKLNVKPVIRMDEELRQDVESALTLDPATDSYEIEVEVLTGIVILSGTVESLAEYQLAEQVVKGVKGTKDVQNDLRIVYPVERPDTEIQPEIERRLELNPIIQEELIEVAVKNGHVTLTGLVGSVAEKNEVVADAWVVGVKEVDESGLNIEWWAREGAVRKKLFVIRTDKKIQAAVEDALFYEPRVLSFKIQVNVINRVVTLTGVVDNFKAKYAAEQTAENVFGVRRVKNYIQVRPETFSSDDEITQTVKEALRRDPLVDRYDLIVTVLNGKVYLRGIVDTYAEKRQAEDAASRVKGVVDVQNSVKVNYEWTWKSDEEIKEDIESEYFWSIYVDGDDITVIVENGKATLLGEVDDWNEHRAAIDNAFEGGAKAVESHLKIKALPESSGSPRYYTHPDYSG